MHRNVILTISDGTILLWLKQCGCVLHVWWGGGAYLYRCVDPGVHLPVIPSDSHTPTPPYPTHAPTPPHPHPHRVTAPRRHPAPVPVIFCPLSLPSDPSITAHGRRSISAPAAVYGLIRVPGGSRPLSAPYTLSGGDRWGPLACYRRRAALLAGDKSAPPRRTTNIMTAAVNEEAAVGQTD